MALVTKLELPQLDYLAEDLKGERFHDVMNELRARSWLAVAPIGYFVLGSIHGIYGLERLPLRWR
jgi:hypothetical protein